MSESKTTDTSLIYEMGDEGESIFNTCIENIREDILSAGQNKVLPTDRDREENNEDEPPTGLIDCLAETEDSQKSAKNGHDEEVREEIDKQYCLNWRTWNRRVRDGAALKDPEDLYRGMWYEGELTALYADTNLGKSILAVQIGEEIAARGIPVMYVDIELSDKGVEKRSRNADGSLHVFPEKFYSVTIDFSRILDEEADGGDSSLDILDRIEGAAKLSGTKVIIIDNITALCAGLESGETAVKLVNRLLQMRSDNGFSILFIAHTPKLDRNAPITRDSMGGSKRIISLIDSAFAIGQCVYDQSIRYVKQTKVRMGECVYHDNNVLLCRIERSDGLLKFIPIGHGREVDLLKNDGDSERRQKKEMAVDLLDHGYSIRDVAKKLDLTRYQVEKIRNEMKREAGTPPGVSARHQESLFGGSLPEVSHRRALPSSSGGAVIVEDVLRRK